LKLHSNFQSTASIFLLFFLLRKDKNPTTASSDPSQIPKKEPLSPITSGLDFAYASDIVEDNSREPGHIVELSF
jgi:hypothetical protein